MAVAAYASLVSLTHVLDNLHYRARFNIPRADINQVEALQKNVNSLLEFVELHSERKIPELRGLWRKMAEAAAEAESDINFHVANLLYAKSQGETSDTSSFSAFCDEMETLIQKFCSIEKEFPVIEEDGGEDAPAQKQSNYASVAAGGSPAATSYVSNVVVGLDEHVNTIRDKLVRGRSKLEILPIVGMGGIGKTTLAKRLFEDSFVVDHFDLLIWLTISQEYSYEQILKVGLEGKAGEDENLDELGTKFYQKLFGRRYLIVMDDMWSTGAWDELKNYFRDDENGSRILLTTRLSNMVVSLGCHDLYRLAFLDQNESWSLFCQNAFSQNGCPYGHLDKFAKDITKSCRGLPLEIVVVGRFLANSDMTVKYWENIVNNISSLANLEDDEHCKKVLSLSYESLSIHLKPCFLYLRVFPEDSKIVVSELIESWISEGFIKSTSDRTLEDIAKEYVKSLIDRNLIFDRDEYTCGIHDLLRDLCLKESANECFLQFPRRQEVNRRRLRDTVQCHLCLESLEEKEGMHIVQPCYIFGLSSQVNPLVCDGCTMVYSQIKRHNNLVKMANYDDGFDIESFQPIELRCVAVSMVKSLSSSTLKLLWNLQTFIISFSSIKDLPPEIWEMPQLREIRCSYDAHFPDPIATDIEGEDFIILKDLHTLNGIGNFNCTKEVIDRIPNLKKLRISYGNGSETGVIQLYDYSLCNLEQLQKLESLSISGCLEEMTFPNSLKELRLINCMGIAWEDMSIVGLLPSLETLEISDGGVHGSEWEPVQGEFRRLKELDINNTDLVCWRAESVHFPILEKLKLIGLRSLEEIPWGIGDILTLKSIDVIRCSESVVDSAKEIWVEQHELGNEIRIDITDEEQGIEYQIGTFTARMTGAACESLAYLKHLPEKLSKVAQHGRDSLNGKQMEAVEEAIHFFKDFFKVFHPRKSQEMESLLREMAQATHKAEIVVRRLRSETLMPILGKCVREDVERLLEKIDFIRKALSVAEEEGQENEQINGDNDATSYDINSLKIMRADLLRYRDEDLREYQIGSVTAALTEDASLIWSDLACALEVLRKASELGRHHLNTKLMENVDKSISFLQDVVKVHPQIILQYTKAIGYGYMYYYLVMAVEDLNSKHLGRQSLEDATDEEILSFSEHVENVLNKLINHRIWFTKASKLKTHSQEESTDEEI
ncbi:putative late blight resistance protein homolog R1B-17 isoform X1 [Andrographis paniculata]|uniref:putative late blight resistance protein homolog R1B-17 isoform X1 n=1 Tax=Andrographis paniculata TaxID=175694 RepID=UPI0021E78BE7|nr:putative late blight resistance protein homolog R1B-17 isoform X1 [Andrographis paniculata]XP_051123139.1 putative late blight resistance protein homolog R1B-17 isoform X1 [Andrographis paniculata]XP_051123140.1 putative late blight resistance protein homolog R1B-17 isoform X1 [Andrographis paniculata]